MINLRLSGKENMNALLSNKIHFLPLSKEGPFLCRSDTTWSETGHGQALDESESKAVPLFTTSCVVLFKMRLHQVSTFSSLKYRQ